jgi:hypothetical protein
MRMNGQTDTSLLVKMRRNFQLPVANVVKYVSRPEIRPYPSLPSPGPSKSILEDRTVAGRGYC